MTKSANDAPSDEELMARMARGEPEPLEELYLRYGDGILRLLDRILEGASSADAEDLCQDVFLRVFHAAPRYREMGKLRAWLYRVAAREARSWRRKQWVRERLLRRLAFEKKSALLPPVAGPDDSPAAVERRVSRAISRLSQDQREVLMLAVGENMNGNQIAEALGIGRGAARVRLHRARMAIHAFLEETDDKMSPGGVQ